MVATKSVCISHTDRFIEFNLDGRFTDLQAYVDILSAFMSNLLHIVSLFHCYNITVQQTSRTIILIDEMRENPWTKATSTSLLFS